MTVECLSSCTMPTGHGKMSVRIYGERGAGEKEAWVACTWGDEASASERHGVHMRVHDACLTSEVLGSLKCDCAQQLRLSQHHLAHNRGLLIYTPQEGRGIGLASKIAAYSLQERRGLDTVDANLALGLPDEARDYRPVRAILDDLHVRSVVLLTNNPFKVAALRDLGISVDSRRALLASIVPESAQGYLRAKAARMGHLLAMQGGICEEVDAEAMAEPDMAAAAAASEGRRAEPVAGGRSDRSVDATREAYEREGGQRRLPAQARPHGAPSPSVAPLHLPHAPSQPAAVLALTQLPSVSESTQGILDCEAEGARVSLLARLRQSIAEHARHDAHTPYVTLTYAQALDGSIAGPLGASGPRLMLSGDTSMALTHAIRAAHEAIVVGSGTVLADDPQLTVRMAPGPSPLRVVLDGRLRVPSTAKAFQGAPPGHGAPRAVVVTLAETLRGREGGERAARLRAAGVRLLVAEKDAHGRPCLRSALAALRAELGVRSVMIEGGASMIGACLSARLAHRVILTLAPKTLVNGLRPGSDAHVATASSAAAPSAAAAGQLRRVQAFCLGDDVVVSADGPASSDPASSAPRVERPTSSAPLARL